MRRSPSTPTGGQAAEGLRPSPSTIGACDPRRLVRRARAPRPSVARDARPLGDARLGGDAPPDAGAAGRPPCSTRSSRGSRPRTAMAAAGPGAVIDRVGAARLPAAGPPAVGGRGGDRRATAGPTTSPSCPASAATPPAAVAAQADDADVAGDRGEHPPRRRAGARRRGSRERAAEARDRCEIGRPLARPRPAPRAHGRRRDAVPAARRRGVSECPLRRRCATRGPLAGEARPRQAPFAGSFRQRRGAGDGAAARGARRRRPSSTPTRWRRSSTTASRSSPVGGERRRLPERIDPRHGRACRSDAQRGSCARRSCARLGEDRLGVELHALDRELAVAQAHHQAVVGLGA